MKIMYTISIVLFVLWFILIMTSDRDGIVHILLVISVISYILGIIQNAPTIDNED